MSLDLGTITVTIEAAVADFKRQIDAVSTSIEELGGKLQPAAVAAGAAFAGIGAGLAYVVAKSSEAHKAQLDLANAIKATGSSLDVGAIDELGASIQKLSTFDDDAVTSTAALMTRLGLQQNQILALTPAVADFAAAMGKDLPDAAFAVSKAIATGSLGVLSKQGLAFDDVTEKAFANANAQQRTAIILDKLKSSFEGAAQTMTQTAGGAFVQMQKAVENLAEAFGDTFESTAVAAMQAVREKAQGLADAFKGSSDAMHGFVFVATGVVASVTGIVAAVTGLIVLWPKLAALRTAFALVAPAALAVTAAVVGVTAAGVALFDLFKANGGTVGGMFDGWVESIEYAIGSTLGLEDEGRGLFRSLADAAEGYAASALDTLSGLGSDIVDWLSSSFTEAFDSASSTVSDFGSWLMSELPSDFADALKSAGETFVQFSAFVYDTVTQAFSQAFAWVQDLAKSVVDTVAGFFGTVGVAIYDAIVGAIQKVVGVLSSVFGTAFDYWRGKFEAVGAGIAPAAAGGAAASTPASQAAQGSFSPLGRGQIEALSMATAESADKLQELRDQLVATAERARYVNDEQAQTGYFLDRLNQVIEDGLRAADVREFMGELKASGVSLDQLANAATKAAERTKKLAERQAAWSAASAEGAASAMGPQIDATNALAEGASATLYNAASKAFGPGSLLSSAAMSLGEALDRAGSQIAGQLVGQMGQMGSVVSAGIQGFQSGGVWGAIIAVIAQIASMAPTFGRINDVLNESLGSFVQSFDGLMQGLEPLGQAIGMIVTVLGQILSPLFKGLGSVLYALLTPLQAIGPILAIFTPIFELLGWALEKLSQGIAAISLGVLYVVKGIAWVWNGIINAISGVFEKIADIEVFGRHPFGFMNSWANSIDRARIATDGIDDSMSNLRHVMENGTVPAVEDVGDAMGGAAESVCSGAGSDTSMCEATGGFSDAVGEATESLLNVPQGYKVAAARFDAAIADVVATQATTASSPPASAVAESTPVTTPPPVTIEQVTVVSDDPEQVWRGVQRVIEWDNYRSSGASTNAANPYAVRAV